MIDTIVNSGFLFAVKTFLLVLLSLFVVFSAIVVRQVQLMNNVLTVPVSGGFKFISFALLVFAIGVFLVALVTL